MVHHLHATPVSPHTPGRLPKSGEEIAAPSWIYLCGWTGSCLTGYVWLDLNFRNMLGARGTIKLGRISLYGASRWQGAAVSLEPVTLLGPDGAVPCAPPGEIVSCRDKHCEPHIRAVYQPQDKGKKNAPKGHKGVGNPFGSNLVHLLHLYHNNMEAELDLFWECL